MIKHTALALVTILLLVGCATIGPPSVPRDRFDYNTAVSDSWKEQTLLNIVKLRYADMPVFMEVASIVSGYTLESTVNLSGTLFEGDSLPDTLSLGGSGRYIDRPTITYAPIAGSDFNKNFMTPIPPSAVLFMLQSGWPAEIVLPITLEAVNGLRAQQSTGVGQRVGHEGYYRMVELLGILQRAGAVGMRVEKKDNLHDSTVMVLRRNNLPAETVAVADELAQLLGIRPDAREYTVAYAEVAKSDSELAMLTRSTLAIMVAMAGQIQVPLEHVADGRTIPSLIDGKDAADDERRLIHIRSSRDKPEDAFVAMKYRDHWFWISDRDFKSKRTFAYLMLLFSLTESGGKEGLPLVTIPAG